MDYQSKQNWDDLGVCQAVPKTKIFPRRHHQNEHQRKSNSVRCVSFLKRKSRPVFHPEPCIYIIIITNITTTITNYHHYFNQNYNSMIKMIIKFMELILHKRQNQCYITEQHNWSRKVVKEEQ